MNVVKNVLDRYSEGAKTRQESLCCPVDYDSRSLANLPQEIIEKDYGCGDPSRYVREGDVVLDLGSGGGKICYMAASLVGEQGRVIGVDMNDDMLALARKYQKQMAETIGSDRVEFHKAYIQDLALDVDAMENYLQEKPITNAQDLADLDAWKSQHKTQQPLIADHSVDLVISNCVLNLVDEKQKAQLVAEIFRVLKPGGRVAISDIVSDEIVPQHLQQDPSLWSGCISGAFQEYEFLQAFVDAGFNYVSYDKWDAQPWQVVEGIEFRSVTLLASKPLGTECIDRGHAVIYKGPFAKIYDDEGHVF
ncbi:MAG: methyltransferase domain-containing protein, partial [Gammaproteobacteria bacterium]|nr:methyltransferase domain-containing protein [Gammaproteobacteria bacterium]